MSELSDDSVLARLDQVQSCLKTLHGHLRWMRENDVRVTCVVQTHCGYPAFCIKAHGHPKIVQQVGCVVRIRARVGWSSSIPPPEDIGGE